MMRYLTFMIMAVFLSSFLGGCIVLPRDCGGGYGYGSGGGYYGYHPPVHHLGAGQLTVPAVGGYYGGYGLSVPPTVLASPAGMPFVPQQAVTPYQMQMAACDRSPITCASFDPLSRLRVEQGIPFRY